jgi:hypothetical protein
MAFDLTSIQRGGSQRAPIITIHGTPGRGKTTFGASAPSPIFIRTEDGLGQLDVPTFPLCESFDQVMEAVAALYGEHDFQTVNIDSLSALEPLIWQKVAADHGKDSIEDIGFAKGYIYALDYWRELMTALRGLASRGMTVVLIAHTDVVTFQSPETDPYDRYQIKLHKKAFAYLYEQADVIGFAHLPVFVRKQDADDKKGRGVAKGETSMLLLQERPFAVAKNRYSMPESVALIWDEFAKHLPGASAPGSTNASKGE